MRVQFPMTKSFLSVCFWNINGRHSRVVGDKFLDIKFKNICDNHDIVALGELHSETVACLNGFILLKQKIREKKFKGPKIAGGLAVFVKNEIRHLVEPIANHNEDSIWIKICKGQSMENKDIFIGTCYISPTQNKNSQGSLDTFFEEAKQFSEKGHVILQGDFNARTAHVPDFIKKDKLDDVFHIENYEEPTLRNSEDKKTCKRGLNVIDQCKSFDYLILNGRKTGDIFGKCTSFQWNGSSVVDYALVSRNIFEKITYFTVGDYLPWLTDHCPINFKLSLNHWVAPNIEPPASVTEIPVKFRWDESTKDKFVEYLQNEGIKEDFEKIQRGSWEKSPQHYVEVISETLLKCAQGCGAKEQKKFSKIRKNSEPWFDKECISMKNRIIKLAKNLKHTPENNKIREELFCAKRSFKRLTRDKKLEFRSNLVKNMHLAHKKDVKSFWKLVGKLENQTTNVNITDFISVDKWVNHFKNILNSQNCRPFPQNEENGQLDYEISENEMFKASRVLKPGKSPGYDGIYNEMIAAAVSAYPLAFLKLFNHILKGGGRDIKSWAMSILVPIIKKGNPNDPSNYRGISLLSCLAKFFYTILNNRLLQFVTANEILAPNQLGFLPGNRTSDAHIILHNLINKHCHKSNKYIYGCFVDFSKAFDSVPRDILFKKLVKYGITRHNWEISAGNNECVYK